MKVNVKYNKNMSFIGENETGHKTMFDSSAAGGDYEAATPMEIMLEAAAACSAIDVVAMLKKRKKTITDFNIEVNGEKREEHPNIYNKVHMKYTLISPDTEESELERAISLSQDKYCSVSATIKLAGADVTYEYEIKKS
ncbi:MAG: osmotically inducible protein C [Ignavibacteriae bacterium HGW-Ignavibacteriae-4]|jgi:putative redox protein|nr:MAG: osmotically inducible protein C [Ignavibacteriae bacterium HGW-Ignavibacteriae-4]